MSLRATTSAISCHQARTHISFCLRAPRHSHNNLPYTIRGMSCAGSIRAPGPSPGQNSNALQRNEPNAFFYRASSPGVVLRFAKVLVRMRACMCVSVRFEKTNARTSVLASSATCAGLHRACVRGPHRARCYPHCLNATLTLRYRLVHESSRLPTHTHIQRHT